MNEGVNQLTDEIRAMINRYCMEGDFSWAELIGVVELVKHELVENMTEEAGGIE